jgi:hypothetical protein
MQYTLDVETFFFNAATDYLPYYKHFRVTLEGSAPSKKLLDAIKAQNENFAYPSEKLLFRLNGLVCNGEEPLDTVVRKLGTSLKLEPVQSYRSNHCLIINDDDFMQAFETLAPFCDEKDKAFYENLYALHYASATFDYDKSYGGDALIALAAHLVKKYPQKAYDILQAVKETLDRCEYENFLFEPYDLQADIDTLRTPEPPKKKKSKLAEIKARFFKEDVQLAVPKAPVHDGGVAIYGASAESAVADALRNKGARVVSYEKALRRNGRSILKTARELALKKAAAILLDAFDNGAQTLVCVDDADARYFIQNFKAIERIAGRDIPLRITSASALEIANDPIAA